MSAMTLKVMSGTALLVGVLLVCGLSLAAVVPAKDQDLNRLPLLSTFKEIQYDVSHNADGTYSFFFSLPQQDRKEQRDADGKVSGSYAFVDRAGQEVSVIYDADEEGYRPESDSLPQAPKDTPDVAQAREEFLKYYDQTAKYLKELASEEDDSSSSEEDDDDSSEEDSDEDESSEEDSDEDESSEEDSDEEDESVKEENKEDDEIQKYFGFKGKLSQEFGSRVSQKKLSRETLAQETRKRAAYYPFSAGFFGRRLSPGGL